MRGVPGRDYAEAVQRAREIMERPELQPAQALTAEAERFLKHKYETNRFSKMSADSKGSILKMFADSVKNIPPAQVTIAPRDSCSNARRVSLPAASRADTLPRRGGSAGSAATLRTSQSDSAKSRRHSFTRLMPLLSSIARFVDVSADRGERSSASRRQASPRLASLQSSSARRAALILSAIAGAQRDSSSG